MQSLFLIAQLLLVSVNASIPSIKDLGEEVYIGIDNQVMIDLKGCNPEEVELKISSGTLVKRSDSTYTIIVSIPEEEIKVKLYYKKVVCQIKAVKAMRMPMPSIVFENAEKTISKANATQSGKLIIKYPAKYTNIGRANIISFNVAIMDNSGRTIFANYVRGDALDSNTLTMLSKVNKGSKLLINNIITQSASLGAMNVPASLEMSIVD
jgi:hypothetical protein